MSACSQDRNLVVAESGAMKEVLETIDNLAAGSEPVLIEGEPGVGRELIARVLHQSGEPRGPLNAVKGGTTQSLDVEGQPLLIKDVAELSSSAQRSLSRSLAKVPRRILATTDPGLEAAVEADVFYRPLFRKLSQAVIRIPPLRERVQDIAPLAAQLVRQYARDIGRRRLSISTRAFDRLISYPWPGNVAELKGMARRLVVRAKGATVSASDVDAVLPIVASKVPLEEISFEEMVRTKLVEFMRRVDGYPLKSFHEEVMGRVEKPLLGVVMEHTGGNQVKAAEILGLNRNTLRRKLVEHGLSRRPVRKAGGK
jgi:two-component system nitrogen regulation response regulator GlnG